MYKLALATLLAGAAGLAGCAMNQPMAVAANGVCGTYGYVDANNDGYISGDEWNMYRTGSYGAWDVNHDGRISQAEFDGCYRAGGFYRTAYYNPDYADNYYNAFDANHDGYLTQDEYWSTAAYSMADRNHNGRIDSDEWTWWNATH